MFNQARAKDSSRSPLEERVLTAGKAEWGGIKYIEFKSGGAMKTPWGSGKWGDVSSAERPTTLYAEFINQVHLMTTEVTVEIVRYICTASQVQLMSFIIIMRSMNIMIRTSQVHLMRFIIIKRIMNILIRTSQVHLMSFIITLRMIINEIRTSQVHLMSFDGDKFVSRRCSDGEEVRGSLVHGTASS